MVRAACACIALMSFSTTASAQMFEAAQATWAVQIERLISGMGVTTKQSSVSSGQQATASSVTDRGLAQAIVETDTTIAIQEARARFETMQAGIAGLCADVQVASEVEQAVTAVRNIRAALAAREADWVTNGGDRIDIMVSTQSARENALCAPGDAARGLCSDEAGTYLGGFPAGDADVRPFLLRSQYGNRAYGNAEAEVGMIYIDTLLPPATITSQADAEADGVRGVLDRVQARREQALISMGRASVADVILRGFEGGVVE